MKKSELKDRRYSCKICNKDYSSASSLWNHNKKFHNDDVVIVGKNEVKNEVILGKNEVSMVIVNNKQCKFCNKILNDRSYKYKHEKKCKIKKFDDKNKINNINNNNIITNNNNSNNNNNNNNTINNITINAIGNESISTLTDKEIKKIVETNDYMTEIIKYLNFNKRLPQNHIYCITSLEGDYAKYYNHKTKQIEQINKKLLFDKLLVNSFEKLNHLMLYLEISKDIKELINEEKIESIINKYEKNKFKFLTNKSRKKNYDYNINELGYNNKKLIMNTWSNLPQNICDNTIESDSDDISYNDSSSDDSITI